MHLKIAQDFIKTNNSFNNFTGALDYSPKTTLYNSNGIRGINIKSNTEKSSYWIFTKDSKNLLTIRIDSHFIKRWEQRISKLNNSTIRNIILAIYFQYKGNIIKREDNSIKIIYPCKKNCIQIVATESKSKSKYKVIIFKTCYLGKWNI